MIRTQALPNPDSATAMNAQNAIDEYRWAITGRCLTCCRASPRNATSPPTQRLMPTRWKIIVSTATSWSLVPRGVPGIALRNNGDQRQPPSNTAAQPGWSTIRASTAISAAATAAISAARTLSRIEIPLITQSAETASASGLTQGVGQDQRDQRQARADHTAAANDAALIAR